MTTEVIANKIHLNNLTQNTDQVVQNNASYVKKDEEEVKLSHKCDTNVDHILVLIGEFKRGQIILTILLYLLIIGPSYQIMNTLFQTLDSPWSCSLHGKAINECIYNGSFDMSHELYNERCSMNRTSWKFDLPISYSLVSEFDLVCDRAYLAMFVNSIAFIGGAIGTLFMGRMSDKYGRKRVLFASYTLILVSSLIRAYSQSFVLYMCLRFITGCFLSGLVPMVFTVLVELVGPRYRALASGLLWLFVSIAFCLLGLQAYLIKEWRTLEKVLSAPYLAFLIFIIWIPESIRWLCINNRTDEAEKILKRLARLNKTQYPNIKLPTFTEKENHVSITDILKNKDLIRTMLRHCGIWFVNGLVYYGISYSVTFLSGNLYLDFVWISLVELPAGILSIYGSNRLGRRKTTIYSIILTCCALVIVAAVPEGSPKSVYSVTRAIFGVLSKFFITISFNTVYLLSNECFPTIVRSEILCSLSVILLFGCAAAPWITAGFYRVKVYLPFTFMAVLCVLCSILCNWLGETHGKPTLEILDNFSAEYHRTEEKIRTKKDEYDDQ